MLEVRSGDENITRRWGEKLGLSLARPIVIVLAGELGAGKTTFAQGLARGLGIKEDISSPSYNLFNIYQGRMSLYHFDFYRLEKEADLWELDLEEYFFGEGVSLVEWGDKFPAVLPPEFLRINFTYSLATETERILTFSSCGDYPGILVKELTDYACTGD